MTKRTLLLLSFAALTSGPAAADIDLSKLPPAAEKKGVTYERDIRPLFESSCFQCHSGERSKAGLHLDTLDGVLKGSKEGKVVLAGNAEKSQLLLSVARLDPETAMPPTPKPGQKRGGPPGAGPNAPGARAAGQNPPPPGGPPGGAGGPGFGPPPKPLTAEQAGLVRAWITQGAK